MSKRVNNKKGNRAKRGDHYAHQTKVRAGAVTDGVCAPRMTARQKRVVASKAIIALMEKANMTPPVNVGTYEGDSP